MELTTKYDLNDKVCVEPLNIKGTILEISYDRGGICYKIKYFYNGDIKTAWVDEEDLSPLKSGGTCGFMRN